MPLEKAADTVSDENFATIAASNKDTISQDQFGRVVIGNVLIFRIYPAFDEVEQLRQGGKL